MPHEVSKGAQKNFDLFSRYVVEEWNSRPFQFNEEYFKTVVAHSIVFRGLEQMIPDEEWYDGGYRANVVTYSIAKLVRMLDEQQGGGKALNCQAIWKQQAMSAALTAQLKLIARVMYDVITSPEEGLENVTEWCKKELAWQRAQQKRIEILPEFGAELVSLEEIHQIEKDAKGIERIDRGIAAVMAVVETKPMTWRKMRQWGLENNNLTGKEEQQLLLAATPGKVPSERQAAAILEIRRKLGREGLAID
jgi:hypothetical protein